jgi:hypothetical protein
MGEDSMNMHLTMMSLPENVVYLAFEEYDWPSFYSNYALHYFLHHQKLLPQHLHYPLKHQTRA